MARLQYLVQAKGGFGSSGLPQGGMTEFLVRYAWWRWLDTTRNLPRLPKWLVRMRIGQVEVSEVWDGYAEYAMDRPLCRKKRVLREEESARLVQGYREGKTTYELGQEFGIHRSTVSVILKRCGVELRMHGLDESARPEIARLREDGWSYARLGQRFGVGAETLRRFHLRLS